MPLGLDVTVPDPAPASVTPKMVNCCGSSNVAVQLLATSIVTLVANAVPAQAPPQPLNVDPDAGVAVSVTSVPSR
jgi:hypothetical protein